MNVNFPGEIKCEVFIRVNSMIQREMALLLQHIRLKFSVKPGSQHDGKHCTVWNFQSLSTVFPLKLCRCLMQSST